MQTTTAPTNGREQERKEKMKNPSQEANGIQTFDVSRWDLSLTLLKPGLSSDDRDEIRAAVVTSNEDWYRLRHSAKVFGWINGR